MLRGEPDRQVEPVPWSTALAVVLLFGYGGVVVGTVYRIGGLSEAELVAALHATTFPLLLVTALATHRNRPAVIPVVVFLVVLGAGVRIGTATGGPPGLTDVVIVTAFVGLLTTGFAVIWAILGFVSVTAWRWHRRRDRLGWREVRYSCGAILIGGAVAILSYALFWMYFVVGVGDVVR